MPDLPDITIVVTTYAPAGNTGAQRVQEFLEVLQWWQDRLSYDGRIRLHVADDGSGWVWPGNDQVWPFVNDPNWWAGWCRKWGAPDITVQQRHGVGASLNAGMAAAFARGDVVLYAVDDWMPTAPVDLTPWVRMLVADPSIGMVRLGPPHPWVTGRFEAQPDGWIVRLDRHHYAFGHRPALYHARMIEAYGPFAEDVNAYECERLYAEAWAARRAPVAFRYDHTLAEKRGDDWWAPDWITGVWHMLPRPSGPDIVYALPLTWDHASTVELADVEPGRSRYDGLT